jgi:hypothetical protein
MSSARDEVPAGSFVIGDERFHGARGVVSFRRDDPGDPWRMDLTIDAESAERPATTPAEPRDAGEGDDDDDDLPSLRIDRLMLNLPDWKALQGSTRTISDPTDEDAHDQNVFRGPHFENAWALTLSFGQLEGRALPILARGIVVRENETEVPFVVRAVCELPAPVEPQVTAEPPLGRKICRACERVSFDQVPTCPSCSAADWWNP